MTVIVVQCIEIVILASIDLISCVHYSEKISLTDITNIVQEVLSWHRFQDMNEYQVGEIEAGSCMGHIRLLQFT